MTGTGVDKGTLEWPYGPLGLMPSECQVRSRAELPPSLLPPSMHKCTVAQREGDAGPQR